MKTFLFVTILTVLALHKLQAAKKQSLVEKVADHKEFKKVLRTRNNVLCIFAASEKDAKSKGDLFDNVAEQMRGKATLALINCGDDKKLCKKLKANPVWLSVKHYKDGEFNADYNRKWEIKSMVNFLQDPTGETPWEEEDGAGDVTHLNDPEELNKLLSKEKKPVLVMFYAPWCGHCKTFKPEFALAATELKGQAVLAGMDANKQENMMVRRQYNITGFPTTIYFKDGAQRFNYGATPNKDTLVNWMKDPQAPKAPEPEESWADEPSEVAHLTDDDFQDFLDTNPSALIMFYAPWCGHCKKMKPDYTSAAAKVKQLEIDGAIAALDATAHPVSAAKYGVKGYPHVIYFKDGEEQFDVNHRTEKDLVSFMQDPKEPPPPPVETPWEDVESDVIHLTDDTFKSVLKKKKHGLVMFYAPWCGHCKNAKPHYMKAAEQFADNSKVAFAAMDCTQFQTTCGVHEVQGYPTFVYFNYGKNDQKYTGGREEIDFVNFMKDPHNPLASAPPPPPDPVEMWGDAEGHEHVHHLNTANAQSWLSDHGNVLVMFYAPWCGHCKNMKPAYAEAAQILASNMNVDGYLAAVDATAETALGQKYEVKGYPTIKYFKNGALQFDYQGARGTNDLLNFLKSPTQAEPQVPETPWSEVKSNVQHLTAATFQSFLSSHEYVMVMFYAPWCGHCKSAKPHYQDAADRLTGSTNKILAAIDCTQATDLCKEQGTTGYPTFYLYHNGVKYDAYKQPRTTEQFVSYMNNPPPLPVVDLNESQKSPKPDVNVKQEL